MDRSQFQILSLFWPYQQTCGPFLALCGLAYVESALESTAIKLNLLFVQATGKKKRDSISEQKTLSKTAVNSLSK